MGLDMYAYTAPADAIGDKQYDLNSLLFDEGHARDGVDTNFAYWRKFNNLHKWMEDLYYAKGGESSPFNCTTVRLMPEDLDRLWEAAPNLQPAAGFFWGSENGMTPENIEEVHEFIAKARAAINEGKAVIYDSWW